MEIAFFFFIDVESSAAVLAEVGVWRRLSKSRCLLCLLCIIPDKVYSGCITSTVGIYQICFVVCVVHQPLVHQVKTETETGHMDASSDPAVDLCMTLIISITAA